MAAEQRYRVTERLEAGGMAEVFKGEALSVQGFKKQVAIKRVLPHLAQNKNFIAMFLDEARLGARLNHANIVTVFDIGAADNTYFIVMEFVDGCNLKAIIEHYRQQGRRIGVKEAVYMCLQTCSGLSYAHELTGEDGEQLDLVHRDISPPNILISKRGEIKVTDFGLAKATTQLEKTDPGVVKGKFSYLSPEAAMGEPVDERTDMFALGIVLWEMLAGRRLFLGETDYQTVKLVQQANIPSLTRLNPEVDVDLDAIIMKALARDKTQRYQSAREFGDALSGHLFAKQLKVNSFDVATLVKGVMEAKKAAKVHAPREASIIDRLIQEELLAFTSIDDMSGESGPSEPLSPESIAEGAQPLDAGLFENPADWFSDDEDVVGEIGRATSTSKSEPGWREAGVESHQDVPNLAGMLEDGISTEVALPPDPPPPRTSNPGPAARTSRPTPEPARVSTPPVLATEDDPPAKKGSSAGLYFGVFLVVALIAGGAAAYFGGFLP